jgi:phenol 2-monooxygenase (NADPH)
MIYAFQYEFERRKYAQDLIAFDKTFSALFSEKLRVDSEGHGPTHEEFIGLAFPLLLVPTDNFIIFLSPRAFQSYGDFSSGVGVHYAPSTLTNATHQSAASNLIIGQRLLPHILVRAADAREVNIQDFAPSNARFKLFVFPGNHAHAHGVAAYLNRPECFLNKHHRDAFEIITVLQGSKNTANYLELPPVLRPHWSK